MRKKKVVAVAITDLALLVVLGTANFVTANQAMAQDAKTPYPNIASTKTAPTQMAPTQMAPTQMAPTQMAPTQMAPVEQYLMADQSAEIALAHTAAPESISQDAEIMVLGRHGFETAVKGKNGFVCIVERSWTSAPDADFWNPKVRTPICYNAAGAHSLLPRNLKRTDLILAGRTKAQVDEAIFAAVDKKELPAMEPGAMCYMMSKQGNGGDTVPHWPPHLMFYFSQIDLTAWGANLPDSPVVGLKDTQEQMTTFVIAVEHWSDGTKGR